LFTKVDISLALSSYRFAALPPDWAEIRSIDTERTITDNKRIFLNIIPPHKGNHFPFPLYSPAAG
jgi:hypothetical protein